LWELGSNLEDELGQKRNWIEAPTEALLAALCGQRKEVNESYFTKDATEHTNRERLSKSSTSSKASRPIIGGLAA
jgi:hypothetical protein